MCWAACSFPTESRFHKWWGLSADSLHTGSSLLAMGAGSPVGTDALPLGLPAKLSSLGSLSLTLFYKQFCQITFKCDPLNQVTQYNISKIMRCMILLHYLFLSPLILPYLT